MTIFVSGVHGVGKSYLCNRYAGSRPYSVHFSASDLIKRGKPNGDWGVDKKVSNVDDNQIALANQVEKIASEGLNLVLDGHTVLVGKNGDLIPIGAEVFSSISTKAIILLDASVDTINSRIESRDSIRSAYNVEALVNAEKKHAEYVCNTLKIKYFYLFEPKEEEFFLLIDKLME